jgi:hypothetical protein
VGKKSRQQDSRKEVVPYRKSLELELGRLTQKLRNVGLTVEARAELQRELGAVVESIKIQEAGREAIRRARRRERDMIERVNAQSGLKSARVLIVRGGLPSLGKKR